MASDIQTVVEQAFAAQLASDEIELGFDDAELHIIADEWTLVLGGDPLSMAMLAVDDEDGEPESVLESVVNEEALAALRDVDGALDGKLDACLNASPDPLTKALARILEG